MWSKLATRVLIPSAGFAVGALVFLKAWPDESHSFAFSRQPLFKQRLDVLDKISRMQLFQELKKDSAFTHTYQSSNIPEAHRGNHVGQGVLFGPGSLEIDPLIFHNESEGSLIVFYHLGKNLGNENGSVHKGVMALLLDEALCYCGFSRLPSHRGVTARLDLKFTRDIAVDSTVVLKARVIESRGRKCVIDGVLEDLEGQFAEARCTLVEPKWFKYLNWVKVF